MMDLKVCRICLRTDAKTYKYDNYQLKLFYEEILTIKINKQDKLPKYFCFECAILLHKFHKFKEKCLYTMKILEDMCCKGQITYELVNCVDRTKLNLLNKSPLERVILVYNTEEQFPIDTSVIIKEEVKQDDRHEACHDVQETCHDTQDNNDDTSFDDREPETNIDKNPKVIPVNKQKNKIQNQKAIKDRKRVSKERQFKDIDVSNAKKGIKRLILMDSSKWKKYDLSEEDAVQEFQAKAFDDKYTSAAYKCTDCLKGFSQEDMLKRHIKIRHSESKGAIECQFCRMRFKRKCRLRQHIREHYTKFKCLRCNFICVLESTALSHEQYHNGVTRKCKYCGKEFRYSSTYYTHLRTHRSQYVCTLCGSSFVSEAGLHQHKRVKHCTNDTNNLEDEEVNKYCSRCSIHFETSAAYEEHLYHSTMHAEVEENGTENETGKPLKIFEKNTSEKITSLFKKRKIDDVSLKSGKRCKKPTTCHQCGKHFNSQSACMKHHLEQHPGTSFCPPNERHICEICGASLAPGSVAVHKNMHTREKIFACETCGRQFYESVGLKRHMLTHTGEKPFACTSCDKRFTQSASLKLHYRTFHLKQPYPKRNRRKKD
ncbi:zinc finger protein 595-like [Melitaea cinxia]|uniref:zinc finger protein 595-like n=1 Tax=Melitaea cinxia TaxID=113334 RepID=UPI001E26FBF1|nr:zinc finger protein 595-like [Melitaea cinxia]